jgi:hypothetical protein
MTVDSVADGRGFLYSPAPTNASSSLGSKLGVERGSLVSLETEVNFCKVTESSSFVWLTATVALSAKEM